ncbi:unnamed protein product [Macrosiphum euphorbiae]|uniref:Uncharacterized protein n=1 Tax=Macrosiphum euphorbiae TaxID=13131 RepID=A0AAV0WI50_9HEMI|nr:unnamed protein product [Macrosiphum euphorbiae]
MVTVNGRPLTIFNDSGFKKILKPLVEAIGGDFTINSHNIKKHIFSASNTIISEINDDSISNTLKMVYVYLATLATRELNEQHTSENLKILLLDVLKAYNIRKEQIYTITCDNASNMVKLARIMNEECEVVPNDEEISNVTNPDGNNDDSDFDLEYENQDGTLLSMDDIESELFNDQFVNNESTNKEVKDFQESVIEPKSITSCIRCSVYSLQLCVLVGLKNAPITNCITEARKIVKKLRTPKYAT